ncbi:MAG: 16S rRNA (cytosine(967)-C(5))-methyltransferase RsmB [Magnetococcales bacterium]|nr:16S rRNA (cytosine(967)-C(5))-methyltransferase RsmB [Magnetococcales bacterium]
MTPSPPLPRPPANPRRLAVEAVVRVLRDGLSLSLEPVRLESLSLRDKGLALEIAAGTLRHLRLLDAILNACMARPLAKKHHFLHGVLRTALYQARQMRIPDRAAIHEAVELVKSSPERPRAGFVNGVLRSAVNVDAAELLQKISDPVARLAVEHSHPEWLVRRWWELHGEAATRIRLEAGNRLAPLVLRVNSLRSAPERLLAALEGRGEPHPGVPGAIRLLSSGPVESLPGFAEGWFAVQDAAAQWPALLLDPQPGEEILDLCAAPGGKTAQLAALTGNGARICAVDSSPGRLRTLRENLARLGVAGVTVLQGDAADPALLEGRKFHRILADLPCSSTGVIRRHPEIKWRRESGDPQRMAEVQSTILHNAARWLLPGGRLVYAVCSLEPEEGPEQIRDFLAIHPEWRCLQERRFEPATDQMDGFFIGYLQKNDT